MLHSPLRIRGGLASALALAAGAAPAFAGWTQEPDFHHSAIVCDQRQLVWDDQLAGWFDAYVEPDVLQSFLFAQCFSGGFINDLARSGADRVISTAADFNRTAHISFSPAPRGTTWNRFWDDAVVVGENFGAAHDSALALNPYSAEDLPQYYALSPLLSDATLTTAAGPRYAILFTGITKHETERALELAELDVIYNLLTGPDGYDPANVFVLFGDGTGRPYIDGRATPDNLESSVRAAGAGAGDDGSVLLWVSDHGVDRNGTTTSSGAVVRPPQVLHRVVKRIPVQFAFFAQGASFDKDYELTAQARSCLGDSAFDSVTGRAVHWDDVTGLTVGPEPRVVTAHVASGGCDAFASAQAATAVAPGPAGFTLTQNAEVFASVVLTGDQPPAGDCSALATAVERIAADAWLAGGVFTIHLTLNVPGKLIRANDPNGRAEFEWRGVLDDPGIGDLWDLSIAAGETLSVDFESDPLLGVDDRAIEAMVLAAFVQEEGFWWQADVIDLPDFSMILLTSHWELTTTLFAFAAATCPGPGPLSLLAAASLLAVRRRRPGA